MDKMIRIKNKQVLECNYKDGEVTLNLAFDMGKPDHMENIKTMIEILDECKADFVKYLKDGKKRK